MNLFYLDHCVIFRRMVTRDTCFCFVNRFPINIIYLLTLGLCTTYYPMETKRLSSTSLKGVKAAPSFDDKKQQNQFLMSNIFIEKSYHNSLNLYSFKCLINMFKKDCLKHIHFYVGHICSARDISQGPPVRLFDQDYTYFCQEGTLEQVCTYYQFANAKGIKQGAICWTKCTKYSLRFFLGSQPAILAS